MASILQHLVKSELIIVDKLQILFIDILCTEIASFSFYKIPYSFFVRNTEHMSVIVHGQTSSEIGLYCSIVHISKLLSEIM